MFRVIHQGTALALWLCASAVAAEDVVLTVTGDVRQSPSGATWELTLDALRDLPVTSFDTRTIWTDGSSRYTGVSLIDFLTHIGAKEGTIRASALNDYAVTIPSSDAVEGGAIIAYLKDGEPMSVRQKGPLWIIYPFDDQPDYQTETYYSRSIWQLKALKIIADK